MFKCRIKHMETQFQMSQTSAFTTYTSISSCAWIPYLWTNSFRFIKYQIYKYHYAFTIVLTCGIISTCLCVSASVYGKLFIILYYIITYIILQYIGIKILTVLAIYNYSYKFQLLVEWCWLTIKPKHTENRNL
jgi:hypothetical protein